MTAKSGKPSDSTHGYRCEWFPIDASHVLARAKAAHRAEPGVDEQTGAPTGWLTIKVKYFINLTKSLLKVIIP
jgi:hypothetical protein